MSRASVVAAVVIAAFASASQAVASESVAPRFKIRPLLVKTSDGASVSFQLDRQARRSLVTIAGLDATVHVTATASSSDYTALVTSRALHAGHLYWVRVRVVSRSGGVADQTERLYLHRRFPV